MKEEKKKTTFWSVIWSYYKNNHVSHWLLTLGFYIFGFVYGLYLGYRIDVPNLITGAFILFFYLLGMEFLNLLFLNDNEMERSLISDFGNQNYKLNFFLLSAALIGAGMTLSIIHLHAPLTLYISAGIVLAILLYTVKPARLIFSGYGEILQTFLIAFLVPTFGYSIQTNGNLHYRLVYVCLPLFFVVLAHLYISENRSLSSDIQKYRTTAVMRYGSELTLRIAMYLIAISYVFILLLGLNKLPWRFVVRWYVSIPLAVYLIWHLNRIYNGSKPDWILVNLLSNALVWLNLLLMAYAFLFL